MIVIRKKMICELKVNSIIFVGNKNIFNFKKIYVIK